MLYYFCFEAKPGEAAPSGASEALLAHFMVDAPGVDEAAERVVANARALNVRVGEVRRAQFLGHPSEVTSDPRLLDLFNASQATGLAYTIEPDPIPLRAADSSIFEIWPPHGNSSQSLASESENL